MALHRNALAYSATGLASSMMNSVFFFYYVKLFLDKYKVSEEWFQTAQIIYMIWNAINDPLFGYFQDQSTWEFCSNRQKAILYGAPIWAICFLLPWFPWYEPGAWMAGVHLTVSLCAYDALLTFVLLSQCAIFAEISVDHEERLRLVKYSQVASVIGNTSVFFSGVVSDNMANLFHLQLFCVLIALLAWACMRYSALNVRTMYDKDVSQKKSLLDDGKADMGVRDAFRITLEILKNKNFIAFVVMNFCQVLHVTFCANFLLIFANHLIPADVLPSMARSAVYGASFILPQLMILLGGGIISKIGSYRIIMGSFFVQIVLGVMLYLVGPHHYYFLALFFILDMSIPNAAFSLFNIPLSDIIDEDVAINKPKLPRSSMIFGTNALITKPANSLAPMMAVAILNRRDILVVDMIRPRPIISSRYHTLMEIGIGHERYGYETLKESAIPGAVVPDGQEAPRQQEITDLHSSMFSLMCAYPIFLSVVQIISWSLYKLRSSHSTESKYVDM